MGGGEEQKATSRVQCEETQLEKLNDELKLDLAQTTIDIAGVANSMPVSDVIEAGQNISQG